MAEQGSKRIFGVHQTNGGALVGFDKQNALYAAQQANTTPSGFNIDDASINWYMGPDENQTISLGDYNLPCAIIAYTHFTQEGRQAVSTVGTQGNDGQPGTEPAYVAFKRCAAAVDGNDNTGVGVVADQSFIDMALEVAALNGGPSTFHNSFEAKYYLENTVPGGAWTNFDPTAHWALNNAEWKWALFHKTCGEQGDIQSGVFRIKPSDAAAMDSFADTVQGVSLNLLYDSVPNWTPHGQNAWVPQKATNDQGVYTAVYDSKLEVQAAHQSDFDSQLWWNHEGVVTTNPSDCEAEGTSDFTPE